MSSYKTIELSLHGLVGTSASVVGLYRVERHIFSPVPFALYYISSLIC